MRNLTDELASRLGYENETGVVIFRVDAGSPADLVGLVPQMLIKEVNRKKVRNTKEFNEIILEAKKERGVALLLVQMEGKSSTVLLELSE